jgi:hypothetical protein
MRLLVHKWDEVAFVILAVEAIAWLVAEIFLARFLGYPIVIVTLVIFFIHTLAVFKELGDEGEPVPEVQEPQLVEVDT